MFTALVDRINLGHECYKLCLQASLAGLMSAAAPAALFAGLTSVG